MVVGSLASRYVPTATFLSDFGSRVIRSRTRPRRDEGDRARGRDPRHHARDPAARGVPGRDRAATAAHAGVDDGEVDALRHVRQRVREHERALEHRRAAMPCVMSMISASGAIRFITPWQMPTKSSWSPKSVRKVIEHSRAATLTPPTAATRPSRSCAPPRRRPRGRPTLRRESSAARSRRPGAHPDRGERPRGRAGGEHDEIALGRLVRPQEPRAVQRDEVGAELVDRASPRALGGREEHPARAAAETRRAGRPATTPPGRRRARAAARAAPRPCPGPTAATCGSCPVARRAISSAPFGLVTITQS